MFPELFRIGGFTVHTYGVLFALSLLVGTYVAARVGAREGLPRERIYDLGLWMALGVIVGSKLLLVLTEPSYFRDPLKLVSFDFLRSGGVFYGGLIGATTACYIGVRRYRLPWWKTGDAAACGIALGQFIGRLGCFSAGCCWGKPTALPWGVTFGEEAHENTGCPAGVALHPTQLYESLSALAIFFLLLWLHRRKRFDGQVLLSYGMLYGLARFTIEFFRDDARGDLAGLSSLTGLSPSQLISLALALSSLVLFILRRRAGAGATGKAAA